MNVRVRMRMRKKNGMHTSTIVTGKGQSQTSILSVVILKTDYGLVSYDVGNEGGKGEGLTVTKVRGRKIMDTLVRILMLSPCSIARRDSLTLLPLKSCSRNERTSSRVCSFFFQTSSSSCTAA